MTNPIELLLKTSNKKTSNENILNRNTLNKNTLNKNTLNKNISKIHTPISFMNVLEYHDISLPLIELINPVALYSFGWINKQCASLLALKKKKSPKWASSIQARITLFAQNNIYYPGTKGHSENDEIGYRNDRIFISYKILNTFCGYTPDELIERLHFFETGGRQVKDIEYIAIYKSITLALEFFVDKSISPTGKELDSYVDHSISTTRLVRYLVNKIHDTKKIKEILVSYKNLKEIADSFSWSTKRDHIEKYDYLSTLIPGNKEKSQNSSVWDTIEPTDKPIEKGKNKKRTFFYQYKIEPIDPPVAKKGKKNNKSKQIGWSDYYTDISFNTRR